MGWHFHRGPTAMHYPRRRRRERQRPNLIVGIGDNFDFLPGLEIKTLDRVFGFGSDKFFVGSPREGDLAIEIGKGFAALIAAKIPKIAPLEAAQVRLAG